MIIDVKIPQLSESVSEATLVSWHKKAGEAVARDENLIDIETDKVVLELPAPDSGVLVKIVKGDGESVASGDLIAQIDTEAKVSAGGTPAAKVEATPAVKAEAKAAPTPGPAARKLMEEKGLSAADIAATGPGGRILKSDVTGATKPAAPAPAGAPSRLTLPSTPAALPQPAVFTAEEIIAERPEQRVPMSRLRARVAERLVQSQSTNAILTTFNEVNMAPVMDLRNKYKDKFEKEHGVKLGFMSFFVKAAVHALKKFPVLNASIYLGYKDIFPAEPALAAEPVARKS